MNIRCRSPHRNHTLRRSNRGVILVVLVVVMCLALTLFGVWARQAVRERRQLESQQFRLQAIRLAEAGARRAVAQYAADKNFSGESWSVPADELGKRYAAIVQIKVAPADDKKTLRYSATAEFPAGAARRATITKSIELPNPVSTDQP